MCCVGAEPSVMYCFNPVVVEASFYMHWKSLWCVRVMTE